MIIKEDAVKYFLVLGFPAYQQMSTSWDALQASEQGKGPVPSRSEWTVGVVFCLVTWLWGRWLTLLTFNTSSLQFGVVFWGKDYRYLICNPSSFRKAWKNSLLNMSLFATRLFVLTTLLRVLKLKYDNLSLLILYTSADLIWVSYCLILCIQSSLKYTKSLPRLQHGVSFLNSNSDTVSCCCRWHHLSNRWVLVHERTILSIYQPIGAWTKPSVILSFVCLNDHFVAFLCRVARTHKMWQGQNESCDIPSAT